MLRRSVFLVVALLALAGPARACQPTLAILLFDYNGKDAAL